MTLEEIEEALRAAIAAAKERGLTIVCHSWGLTVDEHTHKIVPNERTCCVLGAYLLDTEDEEGVAYVNQAAKKLGIRKRDAKALIRGFDGLAIDTYTNHRDFYELGRRLSKEIGP
jgi:hypothetical protein